MNPGIGEIADVHSVRGYRIASQFDRPGCAKQYRFSLAAGVGLSRKTGAERFLLTLLYYM